MGIKNPTCLHLTTEKESSRWRAHLGRINSETNECCLHLLNTGKDCHLGLAQIILSIYKYKDIVTMAIPINKHTWNDCVCRVGSQAGTKVSLEEVN